MSTVNISDGEMEELTSKVEFMLTQLKNVQSFLNKLHELVDKGTFDNTKHGMSLLDIKFHQLIMYCSKLCMYISMRSVSLSLNPHQKHTINQTNSIQIEPEEKA